MKISNSSYTYVYYSVFSTILFFTFSLNVFFNSAPYQLCWSFSSLLLNGKLEPGTSGTDLALPIHATTLRTNIHMTSRHNKDSIANMYTHTLSMYDTPLHTPTCTFLLRLTAGTNTPSRPSKAVGPCCSLLM